MGIETIALIVTAPLLAFFVAQWCCQRNTAKEARKAQAVAGAAELKAWGLTWAPLLLADYAISDLAAGVNHLHQMLDLFCGKDGNLHIMAELDGTFKKVLDIKLSTQEGRDFVAAAMAAVKA